MKTFTSKTFKYYRRYWHSTRNMVDPQDINKSEP